MELPFLTFFDLIIGIIWSLIIASGVWLYLSKLQIFSDKLYFTIGLATKLLGGFVFGLVYTYYYPGGDTTAYYEGAICLNKLFLQDPLLYLSEFFSSQDITDYYRIYNSETGYPPVWIYREPEGFLICKIGSIFTFLSLGSYWIANLLISFLVFMVSWKFFQLMNRFGFIKKIYAAIAILFLPTVAFWCSALSKDAFIYVAYLYLITIAFKWISFREKPKMADWILICLALFLLVSIRSFMLLAFLIPLIIVINQIVTRNIPGSALKIALRITISLSTLIALVFYMQYQSNLESLSVNRYINELEVIQKDFTNNETYGDNKYLLDIEEFTLPNMLSVAPQAIGASLYRPYIWESDTMFMRLSSLEGLLFLFLTFRFLFYGNVLKKIRFISSNEILFFFLISVFILAYIVGVSSILFGVLVRFKAILIPFLTLILLTNFSSPEPEGKGN